MQIAIYSISLAIVIFLCFVYAYREGLRLGMQTGKGNIPPKFNPVQKVAQAVTEAKEAKAQANMTADLLKGYSNMMSYNGEVKEEK